MERFDAVVIGAGAAGMFCAAMAGQAGRRVLLLDNGKKPGRKILMSGGGRCNFTNLYVEPAAYLSQNRHFCKSALARYTQWDFIELVGKHGIAWHEKTLGQLFCDDSAQQIVDMLVAECEKGGVVMRLRTEVLDVARDEQGYTLQLNGETVSADNLVIASGGLSMPGLGASPFGYKIAEQFGLKVLPPAPGWYRSRCISRCWSSFRHSPACLYRRSLRPKTARCSAKTCSLPIVDSRGRRYCRSPATGSRGSLSP